MRRDPIEIIEDIFRILEKEREALSINQVAQRTGIHNVTVKKYIRIIQMIREEPKVDVINTRHSIIIRMIKKRPEAEREHEGE
jgi:response regulator of citrate/malate metabolism